LLQPGNGDEVSALLESFQESEVLIGSEHVLLVNLNGPEQKGFILF